jgi:multidrug efflux pump
MRIWVKPDQLASLGLTVPDLVSAIQKQNAVNPSGKIGGEPAPSGQEFTWSVRAQGRLVSAEEFGNIVVRSDPSGAQVRLSDVARIELGASTASPQPSSPRTRSRARTGSSSPPG